MTSSGHKLMKMATAFALASQLAGGALIAGNAAAADMLGDETVEYTNVEFGTGWYLRGDVGGGLGAVDVSASFGGGSFELGTPISVSVAAGRSYAEGFRLEFGLNQFNNLSASSRTDYPDCGLDSATPPAPMTGTCFLTTTANVNAASMMANAYVDLGEFAGFKPYIGAGIGAAYVAWNQFNWTDNCIGVQNSDCGATGGVGVNVRATGSYTASSEFTYAANAMLGVSYDLSKNLALDLGYRYTYIGDTGAASTSANSSLASDLTIGAMDMHEIRMGFRYEIW